MTAAKTTPAMFRCATCGGKTPVELAVEHEGASRVVARCMESLGPVGKALMSYLALHRPAQRFLTWEKVERLLVELLDVYDAGKLTRDHVQHPLTDEVWLAALGAVRDAAPTLALPLDGHGYLFAIMATMSQKARQAAERDRAAAVRGETPVGYSAAHAPVEHPAPVGERPEEPRVPMPDHVRERLMNFGKGPKVIAPATAPAGINPRQAAIDRTPQCMAVVDGSQQLVEIIERKGKTVTVKLVEGPEGFDNVITIPVKDLR